MDYLAQMKKISDYYKERHEKAVSMGISEGSRYYDAFKEIERRYAATETAAECMDILNAYLYVNDFEKNVYGAIKLVVEILSMGDTIMNDDGEEEYIPRRVKISKDDLVAADALHRAKAAVSHLNALDYKGSDREGVYQDILKYFYDIVDWMLIARETVYHVGRNQ